LHFRPPLGDKEALKRQHFHSRPLSLLAASVAGFAFAVASAPPAAQAQTKPAAEKAPATPEEAKKTLENKQRELEQVEQKTKHLQSDVDALSAERESLNQKLVDTAALIKRSEGQLTSIETRLGELSAQEKTLRGSLNERNGQIASLLSALQRMGRNPPPIMITQREDALKMVRSAMLLASAFPELGGQARKLAAKLHELVGVMTQIRNEREQLKTEMANLSSSRTRLSGLLAEKKASLDERQSELKNMRAAAADISARVNGLNELIARLDKAVTENTGLGAYEAEMKHSAAGLRPTIAGDGTAKQANPPQGAQVALLPVPPKSPDVVELSPGTALGSPGRIKPEIAFSEAKGRLPLPAQGRQVLKFGEKTQYGGQSKGIVLETRQGAQVTSPCDGWIVYAGEFRSYGQLLIINAGGGYHVLLAGLSQIDVQPGQFVLAAEPVGTMSGWSQQAQPAAVNSAPVLYVEFRKEGAPIDPDPWWVPGHQKVQG
jgi:septal ring factor EnvC (AmiA/AmiB activator)